MSVWTEDTIARAIATQTLQSRCLVMVNNCSWTGHECDLLAVTNDLRIIDVEVKISRADLKADAKKDKWWQSLTWGERIAKGDSYDPWVDRTKREYPQKVWKHYYAVPKDIWSPELLDCLPSKASGVLLLAYIGNVRTLRAPVVVSCVRRAVPDRNATRLKPEQVMDIARLANIRMWNSYDQARRVRDERAEWRDRALKAEKELQGVAV